MDSRVRGNGDTLRPHNLPPNNQTQSPHHRRSEANTQSRPTPVIPKNAGIQYNKTHEPDKAAIERTAQTPHGRRLVAQRQSRPTLVIPDLIRNPFIHSPSGLPAGLPAHQERKSEGRSRNGNAVLTTDPRMEGSRLRQSEMPRWYRVYGWVVCP